MLQYAELPFLVPCRNDFLHDPRRRTPAAHLMVSEHPTMKPMRLPVAAAILTATFWLIPAYAQSDKGWLPTWTTASMPLTAGSPTAQKLPLGKQDVTLRQIVHISQGGKKLRITFTNEFGTTPLHIAAVHVAFLSAGSKILPATDRTLTFGGQPSITIAPGKIAASDAVSETVPIFSDLVISSAIPAQALPRITYHSLGLATTFIAAGDQTTEEEFNSPAAVPPGVSKPDVTALITAPVGEKAIVAPSPPPQAAQGSGPDLLAQSTSWYFLKNVEVNDTRKSAAIVTFGDSITDGAQSTPETNRRYPDALAPLLAANKKTKAMAVLNVGISGNRILHEGTGPSALERFDRDVLTQPRARFVILLEGINDIGHTATPPLLPVTASEIIEGMKTLIQRAHSKGLVIFAGTLTPIGGAGYDKPGADETRQQVNAFILTGNAFDGVIDFDKALRDPQHTEKMLKKYDSGDHLHPSDAGYAAMAAAVDLKLFRKKR
jgi:lysophospholipase L1-like esterase